MQNKLYMLDSEERFFNRIYLDSWRKRILVYPTKIGIGTPAAWTFNQAKEYLSHLRQEEENRKMEVII